jgi:hypothetical protein
MVTLLTGGRRSIGDGSDTPRLMVGQVIGLAVIYGMPSIACSHIRLPIASLAQRGQARCRPSDVSTFHDAAGQVLEGDVAATFGGERVARERSPINGMDAPIRNGMDLPKWRCYATT